MTQQPDSLLPRPERERDPDPEIDALLDFDPVHRRIKRSDGWPPPVQRGFIAALARTGSVEHAAFAVHRSDGGAWKLRGHGSGQSFAEAWDAAIDLFHERNPKPARRGGRARGAWAAQPEPEPEPERDYDAEWKLLTETIFDKYLIKLFDEREARLDGRIVEADFYVRQLTWLEVCLDLAGVGEKAVDHFKRLERGERRVGDIVATPVSMLLDMLRRSYWEMNGEPARPPRPALGRHDDEVATGEPSESQHWSPRDGEGVGPSPKREAHLRRNAEAQHVWEEKARADSEAWRRRLESEGEAGGLEEKQP
ncbi:MAG TPA: hypothetical protein VGB08_09455 [Allosphingosinicella sp.]|jgi:hypothetical protein